MRFAFMLALLALVSAQQFPNFYPALNDTYLDLSNPLSNFGDLPYLLLTTKLGEKRTILYMNLDCTNTGQFFKLPVVPGGLVVDFNHWDQIQSGALDLTINSVSGCNPGGCTINVYGLAAPFSEGTASWFCPDEVCGAV